jgi:hypothetical protein
VFDKFLKYHTKILLGDVNANVGREDTFEPTIGNESLHEINTDNEVRLINFAISKNLRVKSTMFPHRNIYKYTWTSPDGKTHNQIDHILVDRCCKTRPFLLKSFWTNKYGVRGTESMAPTLFVQFKYVLQITLKNGAK